MATFQNDAGRMSKGGHVVAMARMARRRRLCGRRRLAQLHLRQPALRPRVADRRGRKPPYGHNMTKTFSVWLSIALSAVACGEEAPHEHDLDDFVDRADCVSHYEEEGRNAAEVDELCAGLE